MIGDTWSALLCACLIIISFRILLFIQFIIILLERLFFYRAYPSVFEDYTNLEALRCSGYTGHPLVLSSFFIMYAILLFIISSWKKKFYIIDTILLVISCIFLSSRTPLIIILLVCISSFLLYIRHNIFKALLVILTMVISFTYIINNSEMATIYMDTSDRIENSGADVDTPVEPKEAPKRRAAVKTEEAPRTRRTKKSEEPAE